MPTHDDDVTIGEVFRGVQAVSSGLKELTTYVRQSVELLPRQYVPRTEVDAREEGLRTQIDGVRGDVTLLKRDQISGLRQALVTAAAAMPGIAGLFLAFLKH